MQELSDVQWDQLLELRVVGNEFKAVKCALGLIIDVGDVRKIILCGCLVFAFNIQHIVKKNARFLILFFLKVTVTQFEAVFITPLLVKFANWNLPKFFNR